LWWAFHIQFIFKHKVQYKKTLSILFQNVQDYYYKNLLSCFAGAADTSDSAAAAATAAEGRRE
jgi:hypothetical protein